MRDPYVCVTSWRTLHMIELLTTIESIRLTVPISTRKILFFGSSEASFKKKIHLGKHSINQVFKKGNEVIPNALIQNSRNVLFNLLARRRAFPAMMSFNTSSFKYVV